MKSNYFHLLIVALTIHIFSVHCRLLYYLNPEVVNGKARSVDHASPGIDILGILLNIKAFTRSVRIGPKWSGGPFFPLTPLQVAGNALA